MKVIGIRIDESVYVSLKNKSVAEERTVSSYIRHLIKNDLSEVTGNDMRQQLP